MTGDTKYLLKYTTKTLTTPTQPVCSFHGTEPSFTNLKATCVLWEAVTPASLFRIGAGNPLPTSEQTTSSTELTLEAVLLGASGMVASEAGITGENVSDVHTQVPFPSVVRLAAPTL